jgi:hypothetical protein
MNIKDIFTDAELALIDSGKYMPGRAVLDAKLDLAVAMEREACAIVCDELSPPCGYNLTETSFWDVTSLECAAAIRARGNT